MCFRHASKKAGAAWLQDNADQIAHLHVLRANREWESFWNHASPGFDHTRLEAERNYESTMTSQASKGESYPSVGSAALSVA